MTPDRADCLKWLEGKGFEVKRLDHGAIICQMKGVAIPFHSAESAYRRLGGPDDGSRSQGGEK